ncbi:hypothetical protein C1631_001295 [Chryseobacterium phosphatilyticum]|uniref:Uncharacterized protein n=1 Tax=Chryseobacterium phosphatilyticum TaxID=475075 RepID=A0A316XC61_9FLAO|nr:hypothetical protein [Chryseobacterium phosphatilyticum]PWN71287.1 hypothetical protein C1631_001295 [Chryseobacterium phosphatilyticum]
MEEFEIPVTYKGQEYLFNGRLATFTYGYKFYVDVNGVEVIFERDDEGNLRAMLPDNTSDNSIEKGLIEAIIEVFKAL